MVVALRHVYFLGDELALVRARRHFQAHSA